MDKQKIKYCSRCGNLLGADKICSGCGKKYPSIKRVLRATKCYKFSVAVNVILIGVICILSFFYFKLYNKEFETNEQNRILNSEVSFVTDRADRYQKLYNEECIISKELTRLVDRYQLDFAYHTPEGDKYHKYGCFHMSDSDVIYADCIYDLENNGFTACYDCY